MAIFNSYVSHCQRVFFGWTSTRSMRGWQKMDDWLLGHSRAGAVCQVARILLFSGAARDRNEQIGVFKNGGGAQKSNQNGTYGIVFVKSKFTWHCTQFEERIAHHSFIYHFLKRSSIWINLDLPLGPRHMGQPLANEKIARPTHVSWPSMWRGKSPTKTWRRLRLKTFQDVHGDFPLETEILLLTFGGSDVRNAWVTWVSHLPNIFKILRRACLPC